MSAYLSARESAAYCGVSEKTIRNWISAGRLSAEKSAGTFRIDQEALDALRAEHPRRPQGAESASAALRAEGSPQGADVGAEAGHLAALVRELTGKLAEQTGLTAVWMERCRVLGDQLALAAPDASQATQDANPGPGAAHVTPTTDMTAVSWRWRALAPWLVAALAVVAVVVLLLVWPG